MSTGLEFAPIRPRLPVDGVYSSHILPRLKLPIAVLWAALPGKLATLRMVEQMLNE